MAPVSSPTVKHGSFSDTKSDTFIEIKTENNEEVSYELSRSLLKNTCELLQHALKYNIFYVSS